MYILLPPSEGKVGPATGPRLDMEALGYSGLNKARRCVAEALVRASRAEDAASVLRVGERIMPEVVAQRELYTMPCAPARCVYDGVLYRAAKLREDDRVLIFSGLFGVTGSEDMIPAYRLSMNVSLPGVGRMKAFWTRRLADWRPDTYDAVEGTGMRGDEGAVTVDMRSEAYRVTRPAGEWWTVAVRDGRGRVVSHMAKRYRGLLTRALLDAHSDDVAEVARTLGVVAVVRRGSRRMLTLVPDELK